MKHPSLPGSELQSDGVIVTTVAVAVVVMTILYRVLRTMPGFFVFGKEGWVEESMSSRTHGWGSS